MSSKVTSICIPRIESSITKDYILRTLCNLHIGLIEKITEIPLRNDPTHKRIIIKIKWNRTPTSTNMQNRLIKNESVNLVHKMPWFWKVVSTHPQTNTENTYQ
jgi:hypothetical protein